MDDENALVTNIKWHKWFMVLSSDTRDLLGVVVRDEKSPSCCT